MLFSSLLFVFRFLCWADYSGAICPWGFLFLHWAALCKGMLPGRSSDSATILWSFTARSSLCGPTPITTPRPPGWTGFWRSFPGQEQRHSR